MSCSTKKSPPPYSLRLSWSERAQLDKEAGKLPLSTYIRSRLFCEQPPQLSAQNRHQTQFGPRTRQRIPSVDKRLLAQILAKQGQIRLKSDLSMLANSAKCGALHVTSETEAALIKACADTAELKTMLMHALGIQEG